MFSSFAKVFEMNFYHRELLHNFKISFLQAELCKGFLCNFIFLENNMFSVVFF